MRRGVVTGTVTITREVEIEIEVRYRRFPGYPGSPYDDPPQPPEPPEIELGAAIGPDGEVVMLTAEEEGRAFEAAGLDASEQEDDS